MAITLEDLRRMNPDDRTIELEIHGRTVGVRGLSFVELAEIDALCPEPLPPMKGKDEAARPDPRDSRYLGELDACESKRLALRVAVSIGLEVGDHAWTREKLFVNPWPLSARLGDGPHAQRHKYAEAVIPVVIENLGFATARRIRAAALELESGKSTADGDRGTASSAESDPEAASSAPAGS